MQHLDIQPHNIMTVSRIRSLYWKFCKRKEYKLKPMQHLESNPYNVVIV